MLTPSEEFRASNGVNLKIRKEALEWGSQNAGIHHQEGISVGVMINWLLPTSLSVPNVTNLSYLTIFVDIVVTTRGRRSSQWKKRNKARIIQGAG